MGWWYGMQKTPRLWRLAPRRRVIMDMPLGGQMQGQGPRTVEAGTAQVLCADLDRPVAVRMPNEACDGGCVETAHGRMVRTAVLCDRQAIPAAVEFSAPRCRLGRRVCRISSWGRRLCLCLRIVPARAVRCLHRNHNGPTRGGHGKPNACCVRRRQQQQPWRRRSRIMAGSHRHRNGPLLVTGGGGSCSS